jgi:branched-chain amino acid transport system permease protein
VANFLQQVVSGLASGGIYASLALALVLIYRATGIVNFAQGEMATFSTFVCWALVSEHGVPYWGAFAATLALSFLGGIAVQRAVIRPVERSPTLTVVTVTIGLFLLVNASVRWIWGTQPKTLPSPFPTRAVHVGGVAFSILDLGVIAVVLLTVLALWVFFQFTKVGLAMRAGATAPGPARLVGIRTSWMLALAWGLAAALGALSGLLTAPEQGSFDQNLMQAILIYAFAAAVLGGLDSPAGAVVGGFALGVGLNLLTAYVGFVTPELRLPVALAILFGILVFRPTGLFGRAAVRRV